MSGAAPRIDRPQALTDGNGWKLVDNGVQRRWQKAIVVTLPAAAAVQLTTALPVAVPAQNKVFAFKMVYSAGGFAYLFSVNQEGAATATALTYSIGTIDATLLNAAVATVELHWELVERLP